MSAYRLAQLSSLAGGSLQIATSLDLVISIRLQSVPHILLFSDTVTPSEWGTFLLDTGLTFFTGSLAAFTGGSESLLNWLSSGFLMVSKWPLKRARVAHNLMVVSLFG